MKHIRKTLCIMLALVLVLGIFPPPALTAEESTPFDNHPMPQLHNPVTVQKIDGLSPDFYMGADISDFDALWQSGTIFRNWDGTPMTQYNQYFAQLADAGLNYVRIRVFNDPFYRHPTPENGCPGGVIDNAHRLICPCDHEPAALPAAGAGFSPFPGRGGTQPLSIADDGKGYGGGNTDIHAAERMGLGATSAGMKANIAFHYSDFWADPGARRIPKAWRGLSQAELYDAIYDFTYDSVKQLLEAGVDIGMIGVGNESNGGVAGQGDNAAGRAMYAHAMAAIDQLMWMYRTGAYEPDNLAVYKQDGNLHDFHIKKGLHRDQPNAGWF